MERELLVFMDLAGETVPVGRLWTRTRGARDTASFEYDPSWLARRDAFGLAHQLPHDRQCDLDDGRGGQPQAKVKV